MAPAGRPKIGKEKRVRVNVMLEPNTAKWLKDLGDGNLSNGIHVVALLGMAHALKRAVAALPKKRRAVNQGAK